MSTDIDFLGDTPLERLKTLMARLRAPEGGCAWDVEQTFETIAPYTIEEAYEVSDAINNKDMVSLKEELGDLMFQVIFHSRMAEEDGHFTVEEVCDNLTRKMVERHPHVFEQTDDRTVDDQVVAWEVMKAKERDRKAGDKKASVLDGVALALPALMRAEKLQKRAARVGFDWPSLDGVVDKIIEECKELKEATATNDADSIEDEMGDVLFAVTNLARKLGVDPEHALRRTNRKFITRFQHIETSAKKSGQSLKDMSLDEMEVLWVEAKQQ